MTSFETVEHSESEQYGSLSSAIEGNYSSAAVVTNSIPCSVVGRNILAKGGSAVDAIIASLLCEGLTAMQNMGLGGGVFMTIYKRNERKAYILDAREAAPLRASRNMFHGISTRSSTGYNNVSVAIIGGSAIAVPGELMGYWEAHRRFGVLPWRELFQPAIAMCKEGIPINARLARTFRHSGMEAEIMDSPTLRQVLALDGYLPRAGELMTMPALARTLATVADDRNGALSLYNGSLTDDFLYDLQSVGSLISREDLMQYRVKWYQPTTVHLNGGYTLYSAPPPASGAILAFIIQALEGQLYVDSRPNLTNYLRIAEAFKYGYALRTELGDPSYVDVTLALEKCASKNYIGGIISRLYKIKQTGNVPEDYGAIYDAGRSGGTINIVVQAPDGDAVVATSTINTLFGSMLASPSTGIIFNNEMDDFSSPRIVNSFGIPPSPANFIEAGKRPLSSAAPTIIAGPSGDVRMAIGSAGGTHITSAIAQVIMNHLWHGMSLKQAVDMPRIHHQLIPMVLQYEHGLPKSVIAGLARAGHTTKQMIPHSSVTAIANVDGGVRAIYDYRRGGSTSGF